MRFPYNDRPLPIMLISCLRTKWNCDPRVFLGERFDGDAFFFSCLIDNCHLSPFCGVRENFFVLPSLTVLDLGLCGCCTFVISTVHASGFRLPGAADRAVTIEAQFNFVYYNAQTRWFLRTIAHVMTHADTLMCDDVSRNTPSLHV